MQGYDWNDLRYVLALHRSGSFSVAGRHLGTSETTVARRLKALEQLFQAQLFLRCDSGRYEATELGLEVVASAEVIEHENASISDRVGRVTGSLSGVVRITAVPIIAHRILLPSLRNLNETHPDLTVELVAEARNLSLSKREADIAIRFARPDIGGLRTKARKLGALAFAVYAPASAPAEDAEGLGWIDYDDAHADLPQGSLLAKAVRSTGSAFPRLRVSDAETALEAVAAGLGRTILPKRAADGDDRVRRIEAANFTNLPRRDVWQLSHVDQEKRRSIMATKAWIATINW